MIKKFPGQAVVVSRPIKVTPCPGHNNDHIRKPASLLAGHRFVYGDVTQVGERIHANEWGSRVVKRYVIARVLLSFIEFIERLLRNKHKFVSK